jgi:uncharacterized protein (TIGR02996 family)
MSSVLEQVQALRARGAADEALALALSVWHQTRHPVVADVVDLLSDEALAHFSPPRARSHDAFQQAWLEVSREKGVVVTGWLAQTLTERLKVEGDHFGVLRPDYTQTKYAAYFLRLEALRVRPADPRLASALMGILEDPEYVVWDPSRTLPIYAPVVQLLVQQSDVRVLERLSRLAQTPTARKAVLRQVIAELIAPLQEALRRVEVSVLPDEAAWRALLPAPEAPTRAASETELLEQVLRAPRDDGPRLVYADALLERGDPRGEYVTLELTQGRTEAQTRRAAGLLKQHRAEWLGPLHQVLTHVSFERGFLATAELAQNAAAAPATWEAAVHDVRLGTLRSLRQGRGNGRHLTAFLEGGALRSLETCELPAYGAMKALVPLAATLTHLHLPRVGALKHLEALAELPLPKLSGLTARLQASQVGDFLDHARAMLGRLQELEVTMARWGDGLTAEIFARWPQLGLTRLRTVVAEEALAHQLERGPHGVTYTFTPWVEDEALQVLRVLPPEVRHLRLTFARERAPRNLERFEEAALALGATFTVDEAP